MVRLHCYCNIRGDCIIDLSWDCWDFKSNSSSTNSVIGWCMNSFNHIPVRDSNPGALLSLKLQQQSQLSRWTSGRSCNQWVPLAPQSTACLVPWRPYLVWWFISFLILSVSLSTCENREAFILILILKSYIAHVSTNKALVIYVLRER